MPRSRTTTRAPRRAGGASRASPSAERVLPRLLAGIRAARFRDGLRCPRCGAQHVHRWGTFAHRQRYRCLGPCGRTFSDLTATPAAYVKKLPAWSAYGRRLPDALSLRSMARRVRVHPSTAFRWRHRMLAWLLSLDRAALEGWIELGAERFLESRKGQRRLDRPPRHRLPLGLGLGLPYALALLACDRSGHVVSALIRPPEPYPGWLPTLAELDAALRGRISAGPTHLCAPDHPRGPCARFAASIGATFHPAPREPASPTARVHLATAGAYRQRLRRWIARFRGVATRYLPHYLLWHRLVDTPERCPLATHAFPWPLGPPAD